MSVVLYGSQSTASLVVHWLLIELGIEHELHQLDFERREQKSPGYLAINPAGRVPTLLIDGQVLTESAAIAMHLADLHPQAGLAPAPGTAARGARRVLPLDVLLRLHPDAGLPGVVLSA